MPSMNSTTLTYITLVAITLNAYFSVHAYAFIMPPSTIYDCVRGQTADCTKTMEKLGSPAIDTFGSTPMSAGLAYPGGGWFAYNSLWTTPETITALQPVIIGTGQSGAISDRMGTCTDESRDNNRTAWYTCNKRTGLAELRGLNRNGLVSALATKRINGPAIGPTVFGCFPMLSSFPARRQSQVHAKILPGDAPTLHVRTAHGEQTYVSSNYRKYLQSGTNKEGTNQYVFIGENGQQTLNSLWTAENNFVWDGTTSGRISLWTTLVQKQDYNIVYCAIWRMDHLPLNTTGDSVAMSVTAPDSVGVNLGVWQYPPMGTFANTPTIEIQTMAHLTVGASDSGSVSLPYTTSGPGLYGTVTATSNTLTGGPSAGGYPQPTKYTVSINDDSYGTGTVQVGLSTGNILVRIAQIPAGPHVITITLTTRTV